MGRNYIFFIKVETNELKLKMDLQFCKKLTIIIPNTTKENEDEMSDGDALLQLDTYKSTSLYNILQQVYAHTCYVPVHRCSQYQSYGYSKSQSLL